MAFKQKSGSPFQRNFGVGKSPAKQQSLKSPLEDRQPKKYKWNDPQQRRHDETEHPHKGLKPVDEGDGSFTNVHGTWTSIDEFKENPGEKKYPKKGKHGIYEREKKTDDPGPPMKSPMKKSGFKMKGSPMKRNFNVGASPFNVGRYIGDKLVTEEEWQAHQKKIEEKEDLGLTTGYIDHGLHSTIDEKMKNVRIGGKPAMSYEEWRKDQKKQGITDQYVGKDYYYADYVPDNIVDKARDVFAGEAQTLTDKGTLTGKDFVKDIAAKYLESTGKRYPGWGNSYAHEEFENWLESDWGDMDMKSKYREAMSVSGDVDPETLTEYEISQGRTPKKKTREKLTDADVTTEDVTTEAQIIPEEEDVTTEGQLAIAEEEDVIAEDVIAEENILKKSEMTAQEMEDVDMTAFDEMYPEPNREDFGKGKRGTKKYEKESAEYMEKYHEAYDAKLAEMGYN